MKKAKKNGRSTSNITQTQQLEVRDLDEVKGANGLFGSPYIPTSTTIIPNFVAVGTIPNFVAKK